MKVLILAGGYGSRLSEETGLKPKPMVEIGGHPILWHIMKSYSHFGFTDFVILCGYKGYLIKEYFFHYLLHHSDVTIDISNNQIVTHKNLSEPWKVTLLDTGEGTMTGGRVKRAKEYIGGETFMLTYGDGLSDVDIEKLVEFHRSHGKLMTMTSSQPEGRFGALDIRMNGQVSSFLEKPKGDGAWINAGFFVCEPGILDYIDDDDTILERNTLSRLAKAGELYTYRHDGFWHPMDTLKDKRNLTEMWESGKAPWKLWE